MSMDTFFCTLVMVSWMGAIGFGAWIAIRNLKKEWGESFTLFRRKKK